MSIITKRRLDKIENYFRPQETGLPNLSSSFPEWAIKYRSLVEGKKRKFLLPMWKQIYSDDNSFIMIVGGRQIFKSTYFGDRLAYVATTMSGSTGVYVTYNDESLSAFSVDKYRHGVLETNPQINEFVRGSTLGQVHRVGYKNFSKTYLVTDEGRFHHVEGKSPDELIIDEAQYVDLEHWAKMREAMATTQGKIKVGGIGGEFGSPYHNLWKSTNQMIWNPKFPDWRNKLDFNKEGLVWDAYLEDVCDGEWKSRESENKRSGYWMPQNIFPHIPLKMLEAEKYAIDVEFSLEWKQNHYPKTDFLNHVLGEFHKGTRRPVTREMVLQCMEQYSYIGLLSPQDVLDIKGTYGDDVVVSMGIDWGSGPAASKTVVAILLYFVKIGRYVLAWIEARPQENHLDQAKYMLELFRLYGCEIGAGDLGYGKDEVKIIQDGGADRKTGELFSGVGSDKFFGLSFMSNISKPFQYYESVTDEHGDTVSKIAVDKTTAIQEFIDMLDSFVSHPVYSQIFEMAKPKLMIPFQNQYEVDWMIDDFTAITRKDLALVEDIDVIDSRTSPKKEFNHPKDSVVAIICALQASDRFESSKWFYVSA